MNAEAIINAVLEMPVNKTWRRLLEDTAEAATTNPELGDNATKAADADNTPAKQAPHVISILKKPRITKPAPPTTDVRENGQAGSADKQSPARQTIEELEDEEDDWVEFVEPPAITISTSQANIDPPKDVITKDVQTQT